MFSRIFLQFISPPKEVGEFLLYLVKNFKSIRNMYIKEIENALILVGKNNTGKTAVLAGFAGAKIAENSDKNDNE